MIVFLTGKIRYLGPLALHLDVQGVGYEVFIPLSVSQELQSQSVREITLHTRLVMQENSQTLYGFLQAEEALLFDFLRDLHGIGPKVALSLLSTLGSGGLLAALDQADQTLLQKVPRIGKSKAEKIIFESSQKKKKLQEIRSQLARETPGAEALVKNQIEEALAQLGFQKKEIDAAEKKISRLENLPPLASEHLSDWVRIYLSQL